MATNPDEQNARDTYEPPHVTFLADVSETARPDDSTVVTKTIEK